jgi:hypothetical protein
MKIMNVVGSRLYTIIPKPLRGKFNFTTQTNMTTTMLWCSAHQPTQEQINELEEKED